MTEAQLQSAVIAAASLGGWLHYHTHNSRRSPAGFPDLILIRGTQCFAWELKSERGQLSDDQATWLAALNRIPGIASRVIRPSNLDEAIGLLTSRSDTPT